MSLTPRMRDALAKAKAGPLRRVHNPTLPGRPAWPAHPASLAALVRHDLVEHRELRNRHGYLTDTWTITDAGRLALDPPPRLVEEPTYFLAASLSPGGRLQPSSTRDPSRALHDDTGAIPADKGDPIPLHFIVEPRVLGRRARELAAFAQRTGLHDELAQLRRALATIDRHRRAGREAA